MKFLLVTFSIYLNIQNASAFDLGKIKDALNNLNANKESACTDVDLRNDSIGENRNQGTIGWCFAYASADLVTNKAQQKVSAMSLAFGYYEQLQPDTTEIKLSQLSGGNDQAAVNFAENAYCLEEDMPSSNYNVNECNFHTPNPAKILETIESYLDSKKTLNDCQKKITQALFKNLSDKDIDFVAKANNISTYKKMLQLNKLNCQSRKLITNKISLSPGFNSAPNLIKDVDSQLNKNNPVNINYNAGFLIIQSDTKEIYNHYSSVFGRRLNKETNTCEYLIRNTWGNNCAIYPKPLQEKCENGSIWIDRDTLNKNLMSVTSIK